ncbi:hypothetical protein [Flavobacterium sp. 3HN19-14]|uniref:hypothetical protein n=1 Tax=Flavobacterium sp. 3HN19-14 TaxID=3448133 RepID=UPI003EE2AA07
MLSLCSIAIISDQSDKVDRDTAKDSVKEAQITEETRVAIANAQRTNVAVLSARADAITVDKRLHNAVINIVYAFRINYSWYNPKSWYKSPIFAFKQFKDTHINERPVMERLYNENYAPGRSLHEDSQRWLNFEDYQKIHGWL